MSPIISFRFIVLPPCFSPPQFLPLNSMVDLFSWVNGNVRNESMGGWCGCLLLWLVVCCLWFLSGRATDCLRRFIVSVPIAFGCLDLCSVPAIDCLALSLRKMPPVEDVDDLSIETGGCGGDCGCWRSLSLEATGRWFLRSEDEPRNWTRVIQRFRQFPIITLPVQNPTVSVT